jgi:hypothetical protein
MAKDLLPDVAALLGAARAGGLTLSGFGYRSHDQRTVAGAGRRSA